MSARIHWMAFCRFKRPSAVDSFIYDRKMFSTKYKQLTLCDRATLLLIPLALVAAGAIASKDIVAVSPGISNSSSEEKASKKNKLNYANYLFDSAIADKTFHSDSSSLQAYSTFEKGCDKKSLRKAQKALRDEFNRKDNSYPLSRLVLVSKFLGEPVSDFSSLSQKTSEQDRSLALRMREALASSNIAAAKISTDEINSALSDSMMRKAFLICAKNTSIADKKLAFQELQAQCKSIRRHNLLILLIDLGTFVCGFFCLILALWKLRKKQPAETETLSIAYPKPKPIAYTIFSICLAVFCSMILCLFARYALRAFIPDAAARSVETILFAPVMMVTMYEFSIRQQGLSFFEGFRFRWSLASKKGGMFFRTAVASFFVMSVFTFFIGVLSVILPSNVVDTSSIQDIFDAINGSTIIPQIMTITVFGPIAEEALFRGYLYSALRTRLGCITAAILSAALFSLAHFHANPYTAFHHFMLGIFTVYLFQKTRSIVPGILLHSLWNIFVTFNVFATVTAIYPTERIFF